MIGHSKGGSLMIQLADAQPYRFSHLVNLDGSRRQRRVPDVAEHERSRMVGRRGRAAGSTTAAARPTLARKPGTIEELARRRARMNPRLSIEWLRHLVTVGARQDADGWRWKIDASMRFGGFGPVAAGVDDHTAARPAACRSSACSAARWRRWAGARVPREVIPYLPAAAACEMLDGVGHFVHIEQPDLVAAMVLDFVGAAA